MPTLRMEKIASGLERLLATRVSSIRSAPSNPTQCAARLAVVPKILVVDDDALVRMMASATLEDAGFLVIEAVDAVSARLELVKDALSFFAVVTDVQMPGVEDGLDLARWIDAEWAHIRIIVVSGYAHRLRDRLPAGAAFLQKPWIATELIKLLHAGSGVPDARVH